MVARDWQAGQARVWDVLSVVAASLPAGVVKKQVYRRTAALSPFSAMRRR
jgi:hypothetical protein